MTIGDEFTDELLISSNFFSLSYFLFVKGKVKGLGRLMASTVVVAIEYW